MKKNRLKNFKKYNPQKMEDYLYLLLELLSAGVAKNKLSLISSARKSDYEFDETS
jgi:hypothetical protein